jgi:ABC-2 type transport system ATP-binding protein
MNRGRLVALDSPAALEASLETPILEIRSGDPTRAAALLAGLEGIDDATMVGRAVHVVAADEPAARARIVEVLEREGIDLRGVDRVRPTLEDVFVSLVRRSGGVVEG